MARRRALLVGVSEYGSPAIASLPIVHQDLTTLQTSLINSHFEVEIIGFKGVNETGRSQILQRLRWVCRNAKGVETLLLYFSGHGIHYRGQDYLVPSDADVSDPDYLDDYLISTDLGSVIDQCPAQNILMVIDACREGVKLDTKSVVLSQWSKGERQKANQRTLCIIFACGPGQYSQFVSGEAGFSLFTKAFSEIIDPQHPAYRLGDVLQATQRRLNELISEYQKAHQEIHVCYESTVQDDQQARVICEGCVVEVKSLGSTPISPKSNVPRQVPPLPQHFVPRPEHSDAVKRLLLKDDPATPGTLVMSAIYGLGGIGKSVLAAALAHDTEVQARFPDGILWTTLGQKPDLLALLGAWIQSLQDYNYKPTTVEAASAHLRTLLYDRQMLLIVDDAWQSDHVEPFRVGGGGCRVMVTTREAVIPDADRYDLDVMSEKESLALLRGYMRCALTQADLAQIQSFAREVGYLPLALELAAVQVTEGFSWSELLAEFKQEVADLALLDSSEALSPLSEEQRRKHSLRVCFNLSLRRLSSELLHQFAWLGVLPEDVTINARMATTLWNVKLLQAKKTLQTLKARGLLTAGAVQSDAEPTYRLHDLMHDTARWLIQENPEADLSGLGLPLVAAHRQLVDRYRAQTQRGLWQTLADDGYIHRRLTWHLEQAQLENEIHRLLQEVDEQGRNGWFKVCDKLGQPAIFVQDLARGWRLAEQQFEQQPKEGIILQVRYALITTSLNSLAKNLSAELMAALVEKKIWTPAQGLAYALQIQNVRQKALVIQKLGSYLPKSLMPEALEATHAIHSESARIVALIGLIPYLAENELASILDVSRVIQVDSLRISFLSSLVPRLPKSFLSEALKEIFTIQNEDDRATTLCEVIPYLPKNSFADVMKSVKAIHNDANRAKVLRELVPHASDIIPEALKSAQAIQDKNVRLHALRELVPYAPDIISETLKIACAIEGEGFRANALKSLGSLLPESLLPQALKAARALRSPFDRIIALSQLIPLSQEVLSEALEITKHFEDGKTWIKALCVLGPYLPKNDLLENLEFIRKNWNESSLAVGLCELTPHLAESSPNEIIEAFRTIQDESNRAKVLREMAFNLPENFLSEVLEATLSIRLEAEQIKILKVLVPRLPKKLLEQVLEAAYSIRDNAFLAYALRELGLHVSELLPVALQTTGTIEDESLRASSLKDLAPHLPVVLQPQALQVARSIQNYNFRAIALNSLVHYLPEIVPEMLEISRLIPEEEERADILRKLASQLPKPFLPEALEVSRTIQRSYYRAIALNGLAAQFPDVIAETLEVIRIIPEEVQRLAALNGLIPYLPRGMKSFALVIAQTIQNDFQRTRVLERLLKDLPDTPKAATLESIREFHSSEYFRIRSLKELIPYLPEHLLNEVVEIVFEIQSMEDFADAWSYLTSYLPEHLLPQILEKIQAIQDESKRAISLREIAYRLSDPLMVKAREIAGSIQFKFYRATALSRLIPQSGLQSNDIAFWKESLHTLAYLNRKDFLSDFAALIPSINYCGGTEALIAVAQMIQEVCRQWR
jgi:hypothetical protein